MKAKRIRPSRKRKLEASRLNTIERSLSDLLPPNATFAVMPDGSIKLNIPSRRGHEAEVLADVAKRLNLPESALIVSEKGEPENG